MTTEADARMVIDKLLETAGWRITNVDERRDKHLLEAISHLYM